MGIDCYDTCPFGGECAICPDHLKQKAEELHRKVLRRVNTGGPGRSEKTACDLLDEVEATSQVLRKELDSDHNYKLQARQVVRLGMLASLLYQRIE